MSGPPPQLLALSPGDLAPGDAAAARRVLCALEPALAAGLPGFLLREPRLEDGGYLELARACAHACHRAGAWFVVHDRAHLAPTLEADAVHLSFRSLRPAEVRPWLDARIALGLSTHAGDPAGAHAGADYLFHGPLRPVAGKAFARSPVAPEALAAVQRTAQRPVLALGGVTVEDARLLRRLGLHGVAVRSRLLGSTDPAGATRAYLEALA